MRLPLARSACLAVVVLAQTIGVTSAQSNETYERIDREMQAIRQLELLAPITVSTKTRAELREETARDLATDYPTVDRENDQRVLVAFGLIEPGQDIGEVYVNLLGEQVAGYYDPETAEMVVVSDAAGAEISASNEVTYAHEVVHALQDQHFDLSSFDSQRIEGSDDASLAITSLIEGDATTAQIQYLINHRDLINELSGELAESEESSEALDNAPAIVGETLLFPYEAGQEFVNALFSEGGWDAVNAAYREPPVSTEQILHPEKYVEGEEPVAVAMPDVAAALGDGWATFDTNTMGEFQMSVILDEGDVSGTQADEAAAGWAGDTYTVVGSGGRDAIAWNSEWDSEDDAQDFAETLATRESERLGADVDDGDGVFTVNGAGAVAEIVVSGTSVSYVLAPDRALVDQIRTILSAS